VCASLFRSWLMQVDLVAHFNLFVFELVRFALLFRLSLSLDFGTGLLVGRVFEQVKVSIPVVRELRGVFLTCVGSLVGRSLLIRGRKQVCDSGPLGCCDVSSDRPKLEWWSKLNV